MIGKIVLGLTLVALGGVGAFAATDVVAPPARAVASYASASKAIVNVRGIPAGRDNASRLRLKGCGAIVIIR